MAMVKAGDPFLLHQRRQQAKSLQRARQIGSDADKRAKGTFRDPEVLEIVDRK
jgi:hypothetical protein